MDKELELILASMALGNKATKKKKKLTYDQKTKRKAKKKIAQRPRVKRLRRRQLQKQSRKINRQ